MKELKVIHGLFEIAGQAYYAVKGLRYHGIKVNHIVWNNDDYVSYGSDISLEIYKSKCYLFPYYLIKLGFYEIKFLVGKDVFHFHFGQSMFFNCDLWLLKLLKKKIFFEFHGSDVRDYAYAEKLNPYMISEGFTVGREKRKRNAEKICKYADGIILHDDELLPHLPDNAKNVFVVPLKIDVERFTPHYALPEQERVCIVHAPTNRRAKGSDYVIEAVRILQQQYDIEFILVENKTTEEAKMIYEQADIIVDQLRAGTYGVFAIEGMALGKPVITYITDDMKERLPEELPIQSANPDTIQEVLERLIKDGKLRHELGVAGRKYVETYHDCRKNAKMLYEIYVGEVPPMTGRKAFEYAANEEI